EELADGMVADWKPVIEPIINPVLELADKAGSYEEFQAGLPGLLTQMDPEELIKKLAQATFTARGMGDATDA
ncbi:MAG: DUF935 family protein, partial [Desulfobacteraceae bacterium]|nr:DUF935 family protein [Desulfobacteraceae bacterium]